MRRGEFCLVDLDPARGSEANNRHPSVIVSNDRANAVAERLARGVVTVVPVTSNVAKVFPFQVLLRAEVSELPVDSKAQAEQVRSIAVERLGPVWGAFHLRSWPSWTRPCASIFSCSPINSDG